MTATSSMPTPDPRRGGGTAAGASRAGCGGCARAEEPDLRAAVAHLSRKYTDLADVVTAYVAEAGLERGTRTLHATSFAERLTRIVGGVETPPGKYPDCALIGQRSPNGTASWFCTGVLVHPRVVLTAAHCQDPADPVNVVALAAVDVRDLGSAEVIGVRRVRVSPDYPQTTGHDISVLVLRRDATVPPVPLVDPGDIAGLGTTTLVGFGNDDLLSTRGFGRQREVTVDVTHLRRGPEDDLDDAEQSLGFESDLEFTAGGEGFDSCNGDSGGPAYVDVGGVRKVLGLTSRATADATTPCGEGGIYTRVDTQRAFIRSVLADAGIAAEL
jgi:endonuclease G